MKNAIDLHKRLGAAETKKMSEYGISESELNEAMTEAERAFRKTLGKKKADLFSSVIKPYMDVPIGEKDEFALPVSIAQRWIFKRVLDLGWSVELFGGFDRYRSRYDNSGRSADKPERIGKKYQWIAYHEFLSHLADNLEFREDAWSDEPRKFDGPWQLWLRDIDPSSLLRKTQRSQWEPNAISWWAPVRFDDWDAEPDQEQWRRRVDLLPAIAPLPIVKDPKDGRQWLVLGCLYNWEEPTPPEEERFMSKKIRLDMLKSYIIKAQNEATFLKWAESQHFMGRGCPSLTLVQESS